jgi:hypothetical protein
LCFIDKLSNCLCLDFGIHESSLVVCTSSGYSLHHLKRGRTSIAVVFLYVLCNAFPLGQRTGSLAHMASSITRLAGLLSQFAFHFGESDSKEYTDWTHRILCNCSVLSVQITVALFSLTVLIFLTIMPSSSNAKSLT